MSKYIFQIDLCNRQKCLRRSIITTTDYNIAASHVKSVHETLLIADAMSEDIKFQLTIVRKSDGASNVYEKSVFHHNEIVRIIYDFKSPNSQSNLVAV